MVLVPTQQRPRQRSGETFLSILAQFQYWKGFCVGREVGYIGSSRSSCAQVRADHRRYLLHQLYFRLMEKENKKARDDSRKGYNETIRVYEFLFCYVTPC